MLMKRKRMKKTLATGGSARASAATTLRNGPSFPSSRTTRSARAMATMLAGCWGTAAETRERRSSAVSRALQGLLAKRQNQSAKAARATSSARQETKKRLRRSSRAESRAPGPSGALVLLRPSRYCASTMVRTKFCGGARRVSGLARGRGI